MACRWPADDVPSPIACSAPTLRSGNGGGFGSAISSVPSLAGISCAHPPLGPQPPTPEAPPGYERRYPQDGYWDPPPAARLNLSVAECAAACDAEAEACDAFEVYVHSPPDRGDCYPMLSADKPFVPLGGGSRTYLKTPPKARVAPSAERLPLVEAAAASVEVAGPRQQRMARASGARARDATAALADAASAAAAARRQREASTFLAAWKLLLEAAPSHGHVPSFRMDIVDVGREVLAANFSSTFAAYNAAFLRADATATSALGQRLLGTIDDYERLLATDDNFLLGRWLAWARAWGEDDASKALLEYGARNQVTLWGPTGQINDYAKKEWSGLVATYHKPRWAVLLAAAQAFLEGGSVGSWADASVDYCRTTFTTVELPWQTDTTIFPAKPTGDAVAVARELYEAYSS